MFSGEETITYTNNSPSALDALWVQLDENSYTKDARSHFATGGGRRTVAQITDGFVLDAVEIARQQAARPIMSSPIRACRSACPRPSKPRAAG